MEDLKIKPNKLWLPVSVVGAIMGTVLLASTYIINLRSDLDSVQKDCTAHIVKDDSRYETMRTRIEDQGTSVSNIELQMNNLNVNVNKILDKLNIN